MRNLQTVLILVILFTSCQHTEVPEKHFPSDSGYAYTTKQPAERQWGSKDNIRIVMHSLKGFEEGNIAECVKDFADSVFLQYDSLDQRFFKNNMEAYLQQSRAMFTSVKISMNDFQSVRLGNGTEVVTIWFSEVIKDKTGRIDSLDNMNDVELKNGKIVRINERGRHYGNSK